MRAKRVLSALDRYWPYAKISWASMLLPPASPCIKICTLDERGFCRGCLRTGEEIGRWPAMSPAQQWQLIAVLRQRRALLSAVPNCGD